MVRVLLLSRYDRTGPSSRLRFLDHREALDRAGIAIQTAPFFPPEYLQALYGAGRRPVGPVLRAYARRLADLLTRGDHDLLWIEKEALPWLPAWLERALFRRPYVLDFDDAWFERYRANGNPLIRRLLPNKLERLVQGARTVVAGNAYLADWARTAGAKRVEIVPTVVDPSVYAATTPRAGDGRFVIGWTGSPSSAPYLREIAEPLRELCRDPAVVVRLVGVADPGLPGVRVETRGWSEVEEPGEIAGFDVGVMPLPDTSWTRGKCGFKLIQYMAAGLPTVASPVGANRDIVTDGETGFLASGTAAWVDALGRLRADPGLRARMGAAGRRRVETRYSTGVAVPALAALLRDAAGPMVDSRPAGQ